MGRILIVFDGSAWFIRAVRLIEHDLDNNEKIYRCDAPLGGPFTTLDEAVTAVGKLEQPKA